MNVKEWADQLRRKAAEFKPELNVALAKSAEIVKEDAKHQIGHYQLGWAPLADSTVKEKIRLGYATPGDDRPLLRTGAMRESIQSEVIPNGFIVGSTDPVAKYQEFGTATIPPRPFIGPAMFHSLPEVEKTIVQVFFDAVTPARRRRVREL